MDPEVLFFPGFESAFSYALLFGIAVYALFAFITVRQVKILNASFTTPNKGLFVFLARIHLLLSLGLLILAMSLLL